MASSGRISLLVSKDLQTVVTVARNLDREVAKRLRLHTKQAAEPIWKESVQSRVQTRLQTRVLSDTARVAVSDSNVTLSSAVVGKLSSGVPVSVLASPSEFGIQPDKQIKTRSRKGKVYTRRVGAINGPYRRGGYVVFPAIRESVPRIASLWMQTAVRTVAEEFEKGAD